MADNSPRSNGTNIPQGLLLSGSTLQQRLNSGATFFGPGDSLAPVVPGNPPVRTFDYQFGVNLNTTRPYQRIPYHTLRKFARDCDLLAMAISHMQNRISSKQWVVRLKKLSTETALEHQTRSKNDPRIQQVTDLFNCPDGENNWRTWVRKLLWDYYVLDAACIAPERKLKGTIYRMLAVDGGTILRKIDAQGMTDFYQQLIKGLPYRDLYPADLLYMAENIQTDTVYGYSRVEMVLQRAALSLARLGYQTDYYTTGNTPEMVAFLPEDTSPADVELWDALYRKWMLDQQHRRQIYWMANPGRDPVQLKKEDLTDKTDEMLNRIICFAFGISPSALVPQVNRAAGQQMADDADEAGETPVSEWLAGEINKLIQRPIYMGYSDMEFAFEDQPEVDQNIQATIDTAVFAIANAVGAGEQYYNEMRERDGKPPAVIVPKEAETNAGMLDDPDGGGDGGSGNGTSSAGGNGSAGGNSDIGKKPAGKTKPGKTSKKSQSKAVEPGKATAAAVTLTIDPGIETKAKQKAAAAITEALEALFSGEADSLSSDLAASYARLRWNKDYSTFTPEQQADAQAEIESIADQVVKAASLDWSEVVPDVQRALTSAAADGVAVAGVQIGLDDHDIFSQANEWAINYAEDRAAELVGMKWVNGELVVNPNAEWAITDTTRNTLKEIIVDALKDGDAPATVRKTIQASTDFSKSRAEMVATTETNFANANAQMEVGKLVGHTAKRSLLSGDHDIDDDCDLNAEESAKDGIGIDQPFQDGSQCSPFHPRCVCLTQTFVPGEEL